MTTEIGRIWISINRVLTIINGFLLGMLFSLGSFNLKEGQEKRIPVIANVILLAILISALFGLIYLYIIKPQAAAKPSFFS